MGLNLSRPTPSQPQPSQGQAPAAPQEEESYQQYDISADRQMMTQTLVNSPEVDALASQIEVYNLESIVSFGAGAADEISKCSDVVLNSMNLSQLDDSSAMLNTLAKIMDKFDIEEIKENPGLFGKLFGNLRKQLDKILAKYHTMGDEVDKIYVQLKQYEADIKQSNRKLEEMFQANVNYYHELVRYILAGEQGCRELEAYIAQRQADMEATGDNSIQFELTTLNQALMMLEQRTQDLRTAENVAMQSIPMIKTMQFSNMNLVRKINSAFIITLPVFKQALTQAIMLKRQRLQAEAMSAPKCSDVVLNSMNLSQLDDSSAMLNTLAKIMDKFDIEEIKENPGLFGKLFGNLRKQLDKILAKYHTMGDEVDKIYVQLKQYEADIKQSNRKLEEMFQANVNYYHELVRYILAGEQGCRELEAYIAQRQADMEATGDNSIQFELTTLNQALMMLEQRTQDLRTAENVAMQSIPMIKTMQFSNMNLVRKINSAFIITLPVFKQALTQAIMLKRQRLQAEAMSALDAKTNEMLIRNAQNTAEQAKMTARLASGSSIKIETLEQTWRTIVSGIDETKQIQENARKQRVEDQKRLEAIKAQFDQMYHMPDKGSVNH